MPVGSRIRANNVYGLTTDNPLTLAATTLNSTGLTVLPAVTAGNHSVLVLDPKRVFGEPEFVIVTVHAALSSSATITRAAYGTVARSHPQNTAWAHVAMTEDYIPIVTSGTRPTDPYAGEVIYETDTVSYKSWNGSAWVAFGGGGGGGAATLAYAEVTANGSQITAETLVLSVNVTVPAGRRLAITGQLGFDRTVTDGLTRATLKEDGNTVQIKDADTLTAGNGTTELTPISVRSPSAGTHTYSLHIQLLTGTGTTRVVAGTTFPTFLLVEDITDSQTPFANQNVPVGRLAYAENTTGQGSITTEVDLTGLTVNITVPDGRILRITGHSLPSSSVLNDEAECYIYEGASKLGTAASSLGVVAGGASCDPVVIISPPAGSHTYKLRMVRSVGTGSVTNNAGAGFPSFILVEDISATPTAASGAPSSTLGYAEVTANQGTFTAETDLTGLSVTVTVPAGRRIRVVGRGYPSSSVNADEVVMRIKEGATVLQQGGVSIATTPRAEQIEIAFITSPTAGTHTYKLAMLRNNGTGNITNIASTTFPSYILVEDITGALFPAGSMVTLGLIASEPWTTYTPTLTNLTLGNGTVTGAFTRIGRTIHYRFEFTLGSTSAVGTDPRFTLPVAPVAGFFDTTDFPVGLVTFLDAGTLGYSGFAIGSSVASTVRCVRIGGSGSGNVTVTATNPFTFGTGDKIQVTGTYEAAS